MRQKTNVWPHGMPVVGDTAERSRAASQRDIELFTEISGDRNPLHHNEAATRAGRRGSGRSSSRVA